jgi:hypothetical protein
MNKAKDIKHKIRIKNRYIGVKKMWGYKAWGGGDE